MTNSGWVLAAQKPANVAGQTTSPQQPGHSPGFQTGSGGAAGDEFLGAAPSK
jgi:hypothetical protein